MTVNILNGSGGGCVLRKHLNSRKKTIQAATRIVCAAEQCPLSTHRYYSANKAFASILPKEIAQSIFLEGGIYAFK